MKIFEITQPELDAVEKFADALWGKLGVDIEFTRHFMDRLNDPRNIKPISPAELVRIFRKEYEKYGKMISGENFEAVFKDLLTNINLPFVMKDDPRTKGSDLVAKTIMRKQDFKTPDPVFAVSEKSP